MVALVAVVITWHGMTASAALPEGLQVSTALTTKNNSSQLLIADK
jgi:hypothetical protein